MMSSGGFEFGRFSSKALDSIVSSTKRINLWEGSVRSGKTIASIVRWMEYVRNAPPGLLMIAGKTERTIRRNLLDTMIQMTSEKIVDVRGDAVYIYGRQCYLASAYDERSEQRIRGITLAG